ncbi:MAG TPA: hypothetical protein VNY76_01610 [Candidatus Acidoferrales bacterium]|jgi:hypothetical protein|nr:hypothetical protein [Candidatus Acidoferrales bacterium]
MAFLPLADLYPGDAGWGDVLFVSIWAFGTLVLAAYYCYRAFFAR